MTVPIEDLVARGGGEMGSGGGQSVLARDEHDPAGPLMACRISRTYRRTAHSLQVLRLRDELGNEQTLRVTEEHPFHLASGGDAWVPAKSLAAGDTILGGDGTLSVVSNELEAHPAGVTVYNLEVEDAHTYFVLAEEAPADAEAVWVHNANPRYKELATQHVTKSGETVLGHYHPVYGYIEKAKKHRASYFDVGSEWDNLVKKGLA